MSKSLLSSAALAIAVLAACVSVYVQRLPRVHVPAHLSVSPSHSLTVDNLVPPDLAQELQRAVVQLGSFPSNIDQNKATTTSPSNSTSPSASVSTSANTERHRARHEQIGEGRPLNSLGQCDHPLLFPNADRTLCILPERVDIGRHYVQTGGLDGKKENVQDSIDRVSSFGKYTFVKDSLASYPAVQALFQSDDFQHAAKEVCPMNRTHLDTFQFNFIIQVPGQTVALHLDAPYFWGASRFEFPQWLLVAMVFSNLFRDQFIDQIQAVAYIHDWGTRGVSKQGVQDDGGEFVYFPDSNSIGTVAPVFRSGIFVDGSKVLHAAKIYRPNVKAPHMPKDQLCELRHIDGDDWEVQCDEVDPVSGGIKKTHVNGKYKFSDLRISIVYRARCFTDAAEASKYQSSNEAMDLEGILNVFKNDLVEKKKTNLSRKQLDELDRLDLAFMIMDKYIKYPLPPKEMAWFPYNYCAATLLFPFLKPVLDLFC